MVFKKIRRARIEARRLYEPGIMPMLAVFVGVTIVAVYHREWVVVPMGIALSALVIRMLYLNDHRWRATDEPE